MRLTVNETAKPVRRNRMLYGSFLEHFHRQVYGGVYDPASPFADEDGFRTDVLEALKRIQTPVIRWPGGCYASAYHWQKGVGKARKPVFDPAWRVTESNAFGTDEFIRLCRKLDCEPYLCTNAGTGTMEEMSAWLQYCNHAGDTEYAALRAENGYPAPHNVKYWSIGNENYGPWEIGAYPADAWGRFVLESAKLMRRTDPSIILTAAALDDESWNAQLLSRAGERLDMISIHSYWDILCDENRPAGYEASMAYTKDLGAPLDRTLFTLDRFGLSRVRIAYDEWNLRGWHHPNIMGVKQGLTPDEYLKPRDENDDNSAYTMADAVFTACFLNLMLKRADRVDMACFSPMVNTRGGIFTHEKGIVLRATYHVFDLYANLLGDEVVPLYADDTPLMTVRAKDGTPCAVDRVDAVATRDSKTGRMAFALINKHPSEPAHLTIAAPGIGRAPSLTALCGRSPDDYNDIGRSYAVPEKRDDLIARVSGGEAALTLLPHSVNVLTL